MLHRNREDLHFKGRKGQKKDVSIENLLAVTGSDHSQDLTHRIREMIHLDNPNGKRYREKKNNDTLPSAVQESDTFVQMFLQNPRDELNHALGSIEDEIDIDPAKIKKIEFSQSFKKDKTEKDLPFTHNKLDKIVF